MLTICRSNCRLRVNIHLSITRYLIPRHLVLLSTIFHTRPTPYNALTLHLVPRPIRPSLHQPMVHLNNIRRPLRNRIYSRLRITLRNHSHHTRTHSPQIPSPIHNHPFINNATLIPGQHGTRAHTVPKGNASSPHMLLCGFQVFGIRSRYMALTVRLDTMRLAP